MNKAVILKKYKNNTSAMTSPGTWLLAICLALTTGAANALGLGELEVRSRLNAPLQAVIPLTASSAELQTLEVRLGSTQTFKRAGIKRDKLLESLEIEVINEADNVYILLTSSKMIREPLLEFVLSLRWDNGRMLREFAVFLAP